ncbi:MAG: nucleotide exchange factor GrpE [Anaerolineae bacterium]|nr:nucleotide exchange factor GrpE [Anaerolineae bacterium]
MKRDKSAQDPADERALALEGELQRLRLELQERERSLAQLQAELERQRGGAGARLAESVQAQVMALLGDVAAPAAQLLTQAHLHEQGRPLQAGDVLAVARRLLRALEDHGLTVEGQVGQIVPFDPDHHEPLRAEVSPRPGQDVVVRFVGLAHQGQLLRRAGVEAVEG